jgi:hypothetical protein
LPPRPADVRFYVDADLLGLAKTLAPLRPDLTYPGDPGAVVHGRRRPPCAVAPAAKDSEWIPVVAGEQWIAITRDSAIQRHPAELASVRDEGLRMVALSGPDAKGTWDQLEIVMSQWRRIEALLTEPGPFIYTATRTSFKRLDLASGRHDSVTSRTVRFHRGADR